MFAVIKTGGKQYKISPNQVFNVEKLDAKAGDIVEFSEVYAFHDGKTLKIGSPVVADAKVKVEVLEQFRDDTVIVFKKKRRHNYRRRNGHRQYLTAVRVLDFAGAPKKAKKSATEAVEENAE